MRREGDKIRENEREGERETKRRRREKRKRERGIEGVELRLHDLQL